MKISSPLEESWQIQLHEVQVKKRVAAGACAEVFRCFVLGPWFILLAQVYQGRWKGVEVAVKILFPQIEGNEKVYLFACYLDNRSLKSIKLLEMFTDEVALMSKLHHRNIITFYGASCHLPNLCILTEWMSKGRLFAV